MKDNTEILARLSKAKIKLILRGNEAFLSTLVLSLNTVIDESIPTACTNGLEIRFNPSFVKELNDNELIFLMAHETWHVAFMHMCRIGNREPERWNHAADYMINLMLVDNGYTMIKGGLLDQKYKGMSADVIYDLLPEGKQDKDNPLDGDFSQASNSSEGEEGNNPSASDKQADEEIESKIEDAIIKAATAAQMSNDAGSIPGGIAKMVDKILNPKLPWQVILANFMSAKVKAEKSWSRRNKRFRSVYLPSRLSESMGNVNIYVDASGSVSDDEFTAYIAEMHEIRDSLKPECMKVISFDTSLKEEFIMEKGEDIDVSFTGGGGTSIKPVIKHSEDEETDVTIIFTDGYFSNVDYSIVPNDVIWVIVNNESWTCPVGEVIHMKHPQC
jgi:predicted metal-dependent peptidase